VFFILLGDYAVNDKNISHTNTHLHQLVKSLSDIGKVGIHPSFQSNFEEGKIEKEMKRLENIIRMPVRCSRQHFLMLSFPGTYQRLENAGIKEDFSMGYADHTGFRSGTCSPFFFFDLSKNQKTPLRIYPFSVMDATLKYYMNLSPEESISHIETLLKRVKQVGGTFISLWHNETLSEYLQWKGWKKVYLRMLELIHSG
jgi:hypothetical protein